MALVGVRPEVVAEAEHAFGNLFHRLHYFAQKMEAKGVDGAAGLEAAITDLEDLLRLVLDYASPLAVETLRLGAGAVLGSLGVALGHRLEAPDEIGIGELRVVADSGHLTEAFRLMRRGLGEGTNGSPVPSVGVEEDEGLRWLRVDGFERGRNGIGGGRGLVAWALAQKLIEAQGGILSGEGDAEGVRWSLRLPLPAEGR